MTTRDALSYYSTPGPMTALSSLPESATKGLPDDPIELCKIASGVIVHERWALRYGWEAPDARRPELQLRSASELAERILTLSRAPLIEQRAVQERLLGNCRDFSTFSTALLRLKGIPARARCGFGSYFEEGKFVDHWIVERWDSKEDRWIQVDTQIDELQKKTLGIEWDPQDMPPLEFLNGGEAWQLCRKGELDSNLFGIFDMWGLWFIQGNLIRDIASLNKVELLPWDGWGVMLEQGSREDDTLPQLPLMDEIAAVSASGNLEGARESYEDPSLKVPGWVIAWAEGGGQRVDLPQLASN